MDCIFCKIINKTFPTDLLYEDDEVLAFRDIQPKAPVHILIIPKKHIHSLNESEITDLNLLGKLLHTAKKLSQQMGHDTKGYRVVMNTGNDGGQTVHHVHLHLLAGRRMDWPPG